MLSTNQVPAVAVSMDLATHLPVTWLRQGKLRSHTTPAWWAAIAFPNQGEGRAAFVPESQNLEKTLEVLSALYSLTSASQEDPYENSET